MPTHKAEADWHGAFENSKGRMRLGSGAFEGAYSYRSRMEDSAPGTNPEELLAAAHAGCFSMSLARRLSADGHPPERITKEISQALYSSRHTVQEHLSNAFDKVGVRGRRALVKRLFFDNLFPALLG